MKRVSQRWTAGRKVELLLQLLRGERNLVDACREHDLEQAVVEGWMERFLAAGERGLKAPAGDGQAAHERQVRESPPREKDLTHELMQLEELYRTAPIGLAILDANLRYLRINNSLADINGLPVQAHLGRTVREVLPGMADTLEPQFRAILTTGEPMLDVDLSGSTPRQPGVVRHWRAAYCPLRDPRGVVVAISCFVQEVTEEKRAEQEIARLNADLERHVRERTAQLETANRQLEYEIGERRQAAEALERSQQQLREILDNTTAVIYLKDTDGRYLLVNRQYESLFHVSRETVVGKTDYDLFPREAADAFRANDREVLTVDRAVNFEENVPHDDGMHIYISVKFPLRGTSGTSYAVCGISTDITLRKQIERQLRASQAQLTALIENTTDAIWSIDGDYRITAFNSVAAQRYRDTYGRPLTLGESADSLAPDEERSRWQSFYDRVLAGERIVFEREETAAGELGAYLISMTPIVADGRVTGATVFAKDISDLRRAEERARRRQAELTHVQRVGTVGEMAAGLAHEINQPLGAIANYARGCRLRILSGAARPDELLPAVEEIAAEALRAGEIIRRLRDLVRKGETKRERVDLNDIVAEAVHVVQPQAREQGVALKVDLAPGLPLVEVDHVQIEQVLVNLLLNGLEAMQVDDGANPELSVRTALTGEGSVEVTVRDAGVGLTPPISENMFQPFFTSKPSGLGVGLAISRSIVEGHGGRIWGVNNADCGATFHVMLPRAEGDSRPRPPES